MASSPEWQLQQQSITFTASTVELAASLACPEAMFTSQMLYEVVGHAFAGRYHAPQDAECAGDNNMHLQNAASRASSSEGGGSGCWAAAAAPRLAAA